MSSNKQNNQDDTEKANRDVTINEPTQRLPFSFSDLAHVITNQAHGLSAVTFLQVDPLLPTQDNAWHTTAVAKVILPLDTVKQLVEALQESINQIESGNSQTKDPEGKPE